MKLARALSGSGFLLLIMIAACVGDDPTSDNPSSSGDAGACTDAQKSCSGTCVSKDDPNAGCASPQCTPCAATTNAAPSCNAGACSFTCNEGFSDCDGNPANGCEAKSASDPANCGGCGKVCGSANTDATKCEKSACVLTCKTNFGHCGTSDDTGCETNLSTNAEHCGACGHSCLGGTCTGGTCAPFQVASVTSPRGVAIDAASVYITTFAPSILRVQHDGKCPAGSPCPVEFAGASLGDGSGATAAFRGPVAPVSDGTTVWWINQAASKIARRATAGGAMSFFSVAGAGSAQNGYLAVAGGKVFWTNGFANAEPTPHVYRADLDGSNVATVATYANPATTFYGKGGIAADTTHVYWASQNSGIFKAAFNDAPCVEGSTCTSPVTGGGASPSFGIAVDANFVYWTEATGIRKAPKGGGSSTIIATDQDAPHNIAVLNGLVYWANTGNAGATKSSIRRTDPSKALCTGTACELVANVGQPEALVAADDGLYWVDGAIAGGVYRLAK